MTAALAEAEIALGLAYREAGNLPAAKRAFENVISIDPDDPLGFIYLGDLLRCQREYVPAIGHVRAGLALSCIPSSRSFGLRVLALAYIGQRKPEQALQAAADALSVDPEDDGNVLVHAQALWEAKDYKQAEAQFQHAARLAPDSVSVLTVYARFLLAGGRLNEARAVVDRAVSLQPDDTDVTLLRGRIAFRNDELEEARDMALWVLSRDAMNKDALHLLTTVKARRSWFSGPVWRAMNYLGRRRRLGLAAVLLFTASVVIVSVDSLPFMPDGQSTRTWRVAFWCFVSYVALSLAHVSWQVKKERRQVKLRPTY